MLRSHQRFKGETNNVFTEKVTKVTLCLNDDKRL